MGIYEKPSAAFLDAPRRRVRHHRRRGSPVTTPSTPFGPCSEARSTCSSRWAATSCRPRPTPRRRPRPSHGCRLTVHVSTKPNRSHVTCGDAALILPTLGRTDEDLTGGRAQAVTVEDSMSMVHLSHGVLAPPSADLRSEVAIVCGLARARPGRGERRRLGGAGGGLRPRSATTSRRSIPGFERFNERVREPGGFELPHPARDDRVHRRRHRPPDRQPAHADRGARRAAAAPDHPLPRPVQHHDLRARRPLPGHPPGSPRRASSTPTTWPTLALGDGEIVDVVSEHDGVERRAEGFRLVSYPTAVGTCAAYFPEANVLVPLDSTAERSNTPTSKSIIVRFERPRGS